ncbi:MAG: hypothetical protein ACQEUB_07735 [Thermodesulfobacteriota bacterium]
MYELLRGPLASVSFIIFLVGCGMQIYRFTRLTQSIPQKGKTSCTTILKAGLRGTWKNLADPSTRKGTGVGMNPVISGVTLVFHLCLIFTPLFLLAHNMLLDWSWGVSLPSVSESLSDKLTILVLACGAFFLGRRLLVPKVRALTTWRDVGIYVLVFTPFLTGFIAYHQFFAYQTFLYLHIISGELLMILIPFTMLNHMLYFFLNRFLIQSEHSLFPGTRTWA